MRFEAGDEWLRQIYVLKTQKYSQHEPLLPASISASNLGESMQLATDLI